MKKRTVNRKYSRFCMLEDGKLCDNCLECNICDVDPKKMCDNCAKCIESESDYKIVEIDDIIIERDLKKKLQIFDEQKSNQNKAKV